MTQKDCKVCESDQHTYFKCEKFPYKLSEAGTVQNPGTFEGESAWVVEFYHRLLDSPAEYSFRYEDLIEVSETEIKRWGLPEETFGVGLIR